MPPAAVAKVQEKLKQAGDYGGKVDGVWGPDSQAALEKSHLTHGLVGSMQLNAATAATLGLAPSDLLAAGPGAGPAPGTPTAASVTQEALAEPALRNIQGRLRALDFYREGVDGVWGARTQSAIERFQQGRGLQATGQLNPMTTQALGLDPNNLAAPAR